MTLSMPLLELFPLMSVACCIQYFFFTDQEHKELHAYLHCAAKNLIKSIRTPWLLQCSQPLVPYAKGCFACLEAKQCCQSRHAMMPCHAHIRQAINETDHGHVQDARSTIWTEGTTPCSPQPACATLDTSICCLLAGVSNVCHCMHMPHLGCCGWSQALHSSSSTIRGS